MQNHKATGRADKSGSEHSQLPAIPPKPKAKPKPRDGYRLVSTKPCLTGWMVSQGGRMATHIAELYLAREFCGSDVTKTTDVEFRSTEKLKWLKPKLAYWQGTFYAYSPEANCYKPVPPESMRAHIRAFLIHGKMENAKGEKIAVPVDARTVHNVLESVKSISGVMLDDAFPAPHFRRWPGEGTPHTIDAKLLIATRNGWIGIGPNGDHKFTHRLTMDQRPRPLARDLFATHALPYPFIEDAQPPLEWLRFLRSIWGSADSAEAMLLQEYMGLSLTFDTSFQKILLLIGPKRSGKGTALRLWRAVLGASNVATPSAQTLSERFGLSGLVGKRLAVIGDARFTHGRESATVTERLLSISGEDSLTIDRKHKDALTDHRLSTRLVIASNEVPRLTDTARALPTRFLVLRMQRSFLGVEDRGLGDRLQREVPAILNWALVGLRRLYSRGYFLQPESGTEIMQSLDEHSSELGVFVGECCQRPEGTQSQLRFSGVDAVDWSESPEHLYDVYRNWCSDSEGRKPRSKTDFLSALPGAVEGVRYQRVRVGDARPRRVSGLRLRPELRPPSFSSGGAS